MPTILFPTTHGADDPERAIVPYIAAATAAVSGQHPIVVCTADAVNVGIPGWAEEIEDDGLPNLADLLRQITDGGGEVWLCSACTTKRGITGDQIRRETTIVGAATIVEQVALGARSITLT
ncbi:MAG: putative peroxiredoxin [Nitriliruptoraceae bacterium]